MTIDYLNVLHGTLTLNVIATAYRCSWFATISKWIIQTRRKSKKEEERQPVIDIELPLQPTTKEEEILPLSSHRSSRSMTKVQQQQQQLVRRSSPPRITCVESWEDTPCPTTKSVVCRKVSICSTISADNNMAQRHRNLLYFTYLPVYLFATAADWLQGPYKYAVYSAYGYDQRSIAFLFVAGFGSGMSVGSIVGGLADSWGRKRMACMYCIVYTFSCLAKHVRHFGILLIGRVLGGIATSLLFSVFDSWLIKAHVNRNIDKSYLAKSFSAANYGSSFVAIVAGLIANKVVGQEGDHPLQPMFSRELLMVDGWKAANSAAGVTEERTPSNSNLQKERNHILYTGGGIRAFDIALIALSICFVLCFCLWDENYGDETSSSTGSTSSTNKNQPTAISNDGKGGRKGNRQRTGMFSALHSASQTVWRSPNIFNLCVISSFFEGSMYVFIFHWTPALRALDRDDSSNGGPPLGTIFATFMVCCMLGTSAFSIFTSFGVSPSRILVYVLLLSSASCAVVSASSRLDLSYASLLLFEACIGAYYPAMSTIKGIIVPEDQRAAIYNVFRLPLNFVVLINLMTNISFKQSFGLCCSMLAISSLLMTREVRLDNQNREHSSMEQEKLLSRRNHREDSVPIVNPDQPDFEDGFSRVLSSNGLDSRKPVKSKSEA